MTISHVLFDCDGTLVDSEILAMRVAVQSLNEKIVEFGGEPYDEMDYIQTRAGGHFSQMIQWAMDDHPGLEIDADALDLHNRQRTIDVLGADCVTFDDMLDTLAGLDQRGIGMSVVTSSELARVLPPLKNNGLHGYFVRENEEMIYSAVNTLNPPKPKPDPSVYLHALDVEGLNADECIAVEDSLSGVKSAVAAGIEVIGFVGASHIPDHMKAEHAQKLIDAGASHVVSSMSELMECIDAHNAECGNKFAAAQIAKPHDFT